MRGFRARAFLNLGHCPFEGVAQPLCVGNALRLGEIRKLDQQPVQQICDAGIVRVPASQNRDLSSYLDQVVRSVRLLDQSGTRDIASALNEAHGRVLWRADFVVLDPTGACPGAPILLVNAAAIELQN
ncbi:hypothetical protein [Bradyrhizobium sp. SSUT77]|uniref:hypothetical protein n=1 Tax=Bradyrhizobium sp. SSUT77 TaxID=3040603 RepID=UPI00244CC411|nr:hypothetical protein [Bradyrhizobium sp. SSUT77]MDH2348578.1 hypothetical protein [Bradyrhizobium sp. SSUT77]